eukprot:scaffold16337_cov76-Cylindrotheca_fusiformis.AAC.1
MSKSSRHLSDWSTHSESNNGMSNLDSSTGESAPEPVVYVAPDVANKEQKAVTCSKFLVFFVLLLAVCGTATATYLLMGDEEHSDFEDGVSATRINIIWRNAITDRAPYQLSLQALDQRFRL